MLVKKSGLSISGEGTLIFDRFSKSETVNALTVSIGSRNKFEYALIDETVTFLGTRGSVGVILDDLRYAGSPSSRRKFVGINRKVETDEGELFVALRVLVVFIVNCSRDSYVGSHQIQ